MGARGLTFGPALNAQDPPITSTSGATLLDPKSVPVTGSLKVCLRLEDETPFVGSAVVRVLPFEGSELLGFPAGAIGEFLFSGVSSGKYLIAIGAPGFEEIRLVTQLDMGQRLKSLFVPMKPKSAASEKPKIQVTPLTPGALPEAVHAGNEVLSGSASPLPEAKGDKTSEAPPAGEAPPEPRAKGERDFWNPHELQEIPAVDPEVSCPTDELLRGVGRSMTEFVNTLERFTATEKLEHFTVQRSGALKGPEIRSFSYVVFVKQSRYGTFLLEEYRNGNADPEAFPAHTATNGSPAMALIFHPIVATGFDFRCEGLGEWQGRQVWQVHFVQKSDKPIQIRGYTVNGKSVGLPLEGRAWIDPGSYQVLRLESELVRPLEEIALTHEHFTIDYKPVQFRSTGQQIWLPQAAEIYVERKGKRSYRRHTFSDFALFNVDAAQTIRPPEESFSFTNTSDYDVSGELTVTRREGAAGEAIVVRFVVPAHQKVFKVVGPGKDVNMPVSAVGDAVFVHEGGAGAVSVDSHLSKGASLDVMPLTPLTPQPPAPPSGPQ
jgi:hypothetical protein